MNEGSLAMPDNVALCINLEHLTSQPKLASADVGWGHPDAFLEAELISEPVHTLDVAIEAVKAGMPRLEAAPKAAVTRGQPSR